MPWCITPNFSAEKEQFKSFPRGLRYQNWIIHFAKKIHVHGASLFMVPRSPLYVPSRRTPHCGFLGSRWMETAQVAYVHWGSFTSNYRSVRRALWFTWFSEPHECIQHLAIPGGHPSNYEPGAKLLNRSDRANTDEPTPYSVYIIE